MKMALAVVVACGVFIVPAYGDDFGDFRIPKHRVYDVIGGLNGQIADATDFGPRGKELTVSAGDLFGWGFWLHDSDPLRIAIAGNAIINGHLKKESPAPGEFGSEYSRSNQRQISEKWLVSADGRCYPWDIPFGVGFSGAAEGFYRQFWAHSHSRSDRYSFDEFRYNEYELWQYDYLLQWAGMAGFGRVRDVTPVYRVDIIESRLRSNGLIDGRLRPETRQRLASLLHMQPEYNRIHDRPLKFMWEEIERILRSDGALSDSTLDAYDLYRIAEPDIGSWKEFVAGYYNPSDVSSDMYGLRNVTLRQTGFFLGLSVRGTYDFSLFRQRWHERIVNVEADSVLSNYKLVAFNNHEGVLLSYYAGPTVEFHRPVGPRWQLDSRVHVHFPLHFVEHGIDAESQLSVTYLIADRWRIRTEYRHGRHINDEYHNYQQRRIDEWISALNADAAYFIDDNLQINLSFVSSHLNYLDYNRDYVNPERRYIRLTEVTIGLAYHFMGGLDAPGIVAPSRLLPRRSL